MNCGANERVVDRARFDPGADAGHGDDELAGWVSVAGRRTWERVYLGQGNGEGSGKDNGKGNGQGNSAKLMSAWSADTLLSVYRETSTSQSYPRKVVAERSISKFLIFNHLLSGKSSGDQSGPSLVVSMLDMRCHWTVLDSGK